MRHFFCLLCLFCWWGVEAQTFQLTGQVTDSINQPLPYANLIATPNSDEGSMAFSITDEKGNYKLVLNSGENYVISISYIGFKPFKFEIKLSKNTHKNIELVTSKETLDEVVIISEIPVRVEEDTISYNTDFFKTGTERKLKELLQNLPGVEVDKNGQVTIMGKIVSTLLVDDKPFFDGNTKLGVENIPADAVESVDAIQNYSEIAFLKNLNDDDKMALNIKLKADKKRFLFGDLEAGIGNDSHYLAHPNVFYYSPKTVVNFIGDLNDIGIKSFTLSDYLSYEGGMDLMLSDRNAYVALTSDDFSSFIANQDYLKGINRFGALNIARSYQKKFDISGYAIYSDTENTIRNELNSQYLSESGDISENRITGGIFDNKFAIAKLKLTLNPTINENLSYVGFFKYADNANLSTINSVTGATTNLLAENSSSGSYKIKQTLQWHKKYSKKHTTSMSLDYQYDQNNPKTNWMTNQPILQNLIPLEADELYSISQLKYLKLHNLDFNFKHYLVISKRSHLYTTLGSTMLREHYTTDDFQTLENGKINSFKAAGFGNDLRFNFNDIFLSTQYKVQLGTTILRSSIALHHNSWSLDQSTDTKRSKWVLLPSFNAAIPLNAANKLTVTYDLKSQFSDAPNYANKFQLLNYNRVLRGNEQLENELFHAASVSFTKFKFLNGISFHTRINYTHKVKSLNYQIQTDQIDRFSMPTLTSNPTTQWNFLGNFTKRYSRINFSLKGRVNLSTNFQELNGQLVKSNSTTKQIGISFNTNFKNLPNVGIGYTKNFSDYSSPIREAKFSNESPYVNLDYDFLKGFILKADYSYVKYRDDFNQTNTYQVANSSLFYQKENSAWGFKISGSNLLGSKFKQQNSFSDYVITDSKTYILPRMWLFSVSYKL